MDHYRNAQHQYGPAQYAQPRRRPRWPWFVGGGLVALPLILLFVSATVNESAKIDKMVSIADGIPAADWKVTRSLDPVRDIGCSLSTSLATACTGTGKRPGPVDLDELVTSTGYDLKPSYIEGCVDGDVDGYRDGWQDRVRFQLCVDGNEIDLSMTAR